MAIGSLRFRFKMDRGRGPARWQVRDATDSDTDYMVGNMGRCFIKERVILVDPWSTEADSTILHEILHAAMPSGLVEYETEEKIVATLEKRLWPLLAAHGLRWPDPKGRR